MPSHPLLRKNTALDELRALSLPVLAKTAAYRQIELLLGVAFCSLANCDFALDELLLDVQISVQCDLTDVLRLRRLCTLELGKGILFFLDLAFARSEALKRSE